MSAARAAAVSVEGVTKRFGPITALHSISLVVPEGAALALIGPNGAGKSTLLKLMSTLARPSDGRVRIRGVDTREAPEEVRSDLGLISHQTLLYDDLTARENLSFYSRMYGLENPADRVGDVLQTVGLWERGDDRVRTFSRGMKQRLAIARATLHDPAILLLDEPFSGLDAAARELLSRMVLDLRQGGRTLVLVTHDQHQALALSDQYAILNRGRLVSQGATAGLTLEDMKGLYDQAVKA